MVYTLEQLNYFRICYIAFNLVPGGLRKVFKQEWDFRYMTTARGEWKDIPQNGHDFYTNETRRSRRKNARYLATIQNGNTAEWDCSCLFFAILFSDSIGTTLSPGVKKDVDDLRQVRNDIAHKNEAELTDVEFQNYVATVLAAFNSLKLPVNDIKAVKNQTSFPTAEVNILKMQADKLKADLHTKEEEIKTLTEEMNSKVESFCTFTFKPSHEIIRRSRDVTRIMKKLKELKKGSNGAVSTIYLSGNPGCGKSQIARQLGQEVFDRRSRKSKGLRSRKSKGLTFVATLNAETLDSLADSYTSLARNLKITEYALTKLATSKVRSPREIIQHLKRLILPKIQQFSDWLIIADNVVDLTLVRSDLPPTGSKEWGHGQVLITTQDSSSIPSNAPHTYHESLSKGMQPDDAVDLLRRVSQISNQNQAEKVAEVLEYQPLALAAAAFYVQTVVATGSLNYSWKNYLETFDRGEYQATEEPLAKQNIAYSKTMTIAIKMAITRALESDEVLREALCLFSLCLNDSLPIEAAVDFVKLRTSWQTEELIRANILKSSLITCSYGKDEIPTFLRVHNIVHEVLKSIFTSDLELRNRVECISAAIKIFCPLMKKDNNLLSASEHVCAKLRIITTHCKVLHEVLSSNFVVRELEVNELLRIVTPGDLVSWLSLTADVCCLLSEPSDANLFSTSACNFVKYLSDTQDDNSLKADAFSVHGDVLRLQCEYQPSLSFYEQAKTIYVDIYDEQSKKVASIYNRLGNVYIDLGQYSKAEKCHQNALSIRKRIYAGEHHSDVAASYGNLGRVYKDLGQHSKAEQYLVKVLIIEQEINREDHRDVAASYSNLGLVYNGSGRHIEAKECHKKALCIQKKIYGEHHSDVAASYSNLGLVYTDLGKHSKAKENHKKALSIKKGIYGEHHSDVAASYNKLGLVYRALGQHSHAKELIEKALNINRNVCGKKPHHAALYCYNLGVTCFDLKQFSLAKEYLEEALNIYEMVKQHAYVKRTRRRLRTVETEQRKHDQAKK